MQQNLEKVTKEHLSNNWLLEVMLSRQLKGGIAIITCLTLISDGSTEGFLCINLYPAVLVN